MPYCTTTQVKAKWAAVLLKHTDASGLPAAADTVAADAVVWGFGLIQSALQARGLSQAQIDGWARAEEFNLDQALYYCLRDGANTEAQDTWVKKYDRTEELKTVAVVSAAGAWQDPAAPTRRVGFGPQSTAGQRFTMDTRW